MAIKVTTESAPAYWASYLVNGDDSGLSEDEKAAADKWLEWLKPGHVVSTEGEEYFVNCWIHDNMGHTLIDYVIYENS